MKPEDIKEGIYLLDLLNCKKPQHQINEGLNYPFGKITKIKDRRVETIWFKTLTDFKNKKRRYLIEDTSGDYLCKNCLHTNTFKQLKEQILLEAL